MIIAWINSSTLLDECTSAQAGELLDNDRMSSYHRLEQTNPNVGESIVTGRLRSLGYHVPRDQVRQAFRSSDPLRWPGVLTHRRPYSVAGPNSLWHIG